MNKQPVTDPLIVLRCGIEHIVLDDRLPDLTVRQLAVLLVLRQEQRSASTIRALATRLGIPKPSACRALDRLQELGLTAREDDPLDRRSVFGVLTDRGEMFLMELDKAMMPLARAA